MIELKVRALVETFRFLSAIGYYFYYKMFKKDRMSQIEFLDSKLVLVSQVCTTVKRFLH